MTAALAPARATRDVASVKPTLASAVYAGWVRHRRHGQPSYRFRAPIRLLYLDLSELEQVFALHPLYGLEQARPRSFRRADYLGSPSVPLDEAVRDRVEEVVGARPDGPIRLLTQLRSWGYAFNPVSFYYCFASDETLCAVVAEITNTPWGERHSYVLDAEKVARTGRWVFEKAFHVSPFFPMEHRYDWRITAPAEQLVVHMENRRLVDHVRVFDATLVLKREELSGASLGRALWRQPLGAAGFHLSIYRHALSLWLKGVTFHDHPNWRDAEAPPEAP